MKTEFVSDKKAIFQSETAKTYVCPECLRPIFTQYEGDDSPAIIQCHIAGGHTVAWEHE